MDFLAGVLGINFSEHFAARGFFMLDVDRLCLFVIATDRDRRSQTWTDRG
jgi:hypothetical protein